MSSQQRAPSPGASLTAHPNASMTGFPGLSSSTHNKPKHSMNTLVTAISAFLHSPNTVQLHPGGSSSAATSNLQKSPMMQSVNLDRRRGSNASNLTSTQQDPAGASTNTTRPTFAESPQPPSLGDQRSLIREMFDGIDKRGRGWITVSATRRALSSFGVRLDHTDMEELLREVSGGAATAAGTAANSGELGTMQQSLVSIPPPPPPGSDIPTLGVEDANGKAVEDDEEDEPLLDDYADLHSGGFGYHSMEQYSTASNGSHNKAVFRPSHAAMGSMANLPYRQRHREQEEVKGSSFFRIIQRVLSPAVDNSHNHHVKRQVPLGHARGSERDDEQLAEMAPRVIAVVPSNSINVNSNNNVNNNNDDDDTINGNYFNPDVNTTGASTSLMRDSMASTGAAAATTTKLLPPSRSTVPPQTPAVVVGSVPSTPNTKITFEMFFQMVMVWQTAARFRQFEARTFVALEHLDNGVRTNNFLPDSMTLFVWHCLMLGLSTLMIFVALSVFSYQEKHLPRYLSMTAPFEIVATVFFAMDIYIRFHTTIITQGASGEHRIDDSPIGIAKAYVQSPWLWVDLFCTLPFRFCFYTIGSFDDDFLLTFDATSGQVLTGFQGCVNCTGDIEEMRTRLLLAKIFMVLRCVKYIDHLWYFKESRLVLMNANYATRNFVFIPMFTALSNIAVLIQTLATVYLSMHPRTDAEVSHGGGLVLARAYYLILTCFATVGYGDIVPGRDDHDRTFFIILILIAFIINASVIGEAVSFFQRSDIQSRKSESLLELLAMCKYFCIPTGLRNEIISFYNHTATSDIMNSYGHKFEMIPPELRRGLVLMSRLRLIRQLPYFDDLHRSARLLLCNCLEKATYCPEQYVIYAGEIGNEMFFLNHGFVDIFGAKGMYLVTLRHGNYFGEMAIIDPEPQKRAADVKAITYCEIYVLSKESFQDLLSKYPRLHNAVADLADKRRQQTQAAIKQQQQQPPPPSAAGGESPAAAGVAPGSGASPKPILSLAKLKESGAIKGGNKELSIVVHGSTPKHSGPSSNRNSFTNNNDANMMVEDCSGSESGSPPIPGLPKFRAASPYDKSLGFAPIERHDSDPREGTMAQRSSMAVRASSVVNAVTPRNGVPPGGGVFGAGSGVALRTRRPSLIGSGPPALGGVSGPPGVRPQLMIEQSILDNDPLGTTSSVLASTNNNNTPGSDQRQIAALIDALEDEIQQLLTCME